MSLMPSGKPSLGSPKCKRTASLGWLFGASRSKSADRYRRHARSALISAYRLSHLSVRAFSRLRTRFTTAPPLDSFFSMAPAAPSSTGRRFLLMEGENLAHTAGDEGLQVLAPRHERSAHLVSIRTLVVDLRRAAAEAAVVAQNALDDVRLHVQVIGQVRCNRSPKVMNFPRSHRVAETLV